MREPTRTEFSHEFWKGESRESFSVDRDPVVDKVVFKTAEDMGDFEIVLDSSFCVDEVVEAVVFKILNGFWRDFSV